MEEAGQSDILRRVANPTLAWNWVAFPDTTLVKTLELSDSTLDPREGLAMDAVLAKGGRDDIFEWPLEKEKEESWLWESLPWTAADGVSATDGHSLNPARPRQQAKLGD